MDFREQLLALGACKAAARDVGDRTLEDCWNEWTDPEDMAWLVRRVCNHGTWVELMEMLSIPDGSVATGGTPENNARGASSVINSFVNNEAHKSGIAYAVMFPAPTSYRAAFDATRKILSVVLCDITREYLVADYLSHEIAATIERESK